MNESTIYQSIFSARTTAVFKLFEQIATQANDESAFNYAKFLFSTDFIALKAQDSEGICAVSYLLLPGIVALNDADYNNDHHLSKIKSILTLAIEYLDKTYLINTLAPNILKLHKDMDNEELATYALNKINEKCKTRFNIPGYVENEPNSESDELRFVLRLTAC